MCVKKPVEKCVRVRRKEGVNGGVGGKKRDNGVEFVSKNLVNNAARNAAGSSSHCPITQVPYGVGKLGVCCG